MAKSSAISPQKYDAEFINIVTKLVVLRLMADRKAKEVSNHA